ncbi:MAG: hypothetical protein RR362_01215 [Raoultibacter sp.]
MSTYKRQPKQLVAFAIVALLACAVFIGVEGCANSAGQDSTSAPVQPSEQRYRFASQEKFDQHYKKHGREFGDISQDEYLQKANDLIESSAPTVKTKSEKTDGDTCYYDTATNEFLVLTKKGVIRTFFHPDDGIDYFNRQ